MTYCFVAHAIFKTDIHTPCRIFLLFSLLLCLYFIRTWFFVLVVLNFAFRLYFQRTPQTPRPRRDSNAQSQQAISRRPSPYTVRPLEPAGFKPIILASERPLTFALDRSATGIGRIRTRNPSKRKASDPRLLTSSLSTL